MVNEQLVYEVFKARSKDPLRKRYSFAIGKFLGEHGEVMDHELKGKRIISRQTLETYTVKRVFLQYFKDGYYWKISCVDKNNNWKSLIMETLNCEDSIITEAVMKFNHEYSVEK